nr:DUF2163 domain-containing protein [Sulfitobacter faviae]
MAGLDRGFGAHIAQGVTTLCHCWQVTRADGAIFAFTDHDMPLMFDGVTFRADTGLSARALAQTSGLAVDNTEALGALSDDAIREGEIEQGRFDGAEVQAWLVNWANPRSGGCNFTAQSVICTARGQLSRRVAGADGTAQPAHGARLSKALLGGVGGW